MNATIGGRINFVSEGDSIYSPLTMPYLLPGLLPWRQMGKTTDIYDRVPPARPVPVREMEGREIAKELPNGVTTYHNHDAAPQVTQVIHLGLGDVLQSLDYTYDADGRRTKIVREDGTASWRQVAVTASGSAHEIKTIPSGTGLIGLAPFPFQLGQRAPRFHAADEVQMDYFATSIRRISHGPRITSWLNTPRSGLYLDVSTSMSMALSRSR